MFDAMIADFAVHILLQSTLLIAVGLLAVRFCGRHKPAVQSTILRVTLIAVLFCPLASLTLSNIGITGYALLPAWETKQIAQSESATISQAINTTPPVTDEMIVSRINDPNGMTDLNRLPGTDFDSTSIPLTTNTQTSLTAPSVPAIVSITSNHSIPFAGWFVSLIWLTGAVVLLAKLLLGNRKVSQLRRTSQAADIKTQRLCQETSETLGLLPPEVKIAAAVHSPCLIGIWKPVILLPEQKTLSEPVLRDIFLHELAHLVRRDCLFHLLARIATAILFFQPLVWRLSRRFELIADDVCDDYVIHYGSGRKSYANTLVDFAEQLPLPALTTEAGLAMVSLRSSLSRRIMRIMDSSRSLTLRMPTRWVVLIALLGITATASAALIVNARTESDPEHTTTVSQPDKELPSALSPKAIPQTSSVNTAVKTPTETDTKKNTSATTTADFRFQGRVVSPDGQPVKQATINYSHWDMPDKRILATTNLQGQFEFTIPASDPIYNILHKGATFIAQADGYGPAMKSASDCEKTGRLRKALLERYSNSRVPAAMLEQLRKRILNGTSTFQFVADDIPLTGRVVNIDGLPVEGAKLKVASLMDGGDAGLEDWEKAAQKKGTDYYQLQRFLLSRLGSDIGGLTLDYLPMTVTDKNGDFLFKGLGRDRIVKLLISGPGIASSIVYARTRKGQIIEVPMEAHNLSHRNIAYLPNSFTHVAGPSLPVEGIVRDSKTQKPMPGVTLQSYHLAGHHISGWTEGIVHTVSDEQGRYRLEGSPIGKNEVICLSPLDQPYLMSKFVAETSTGDPTLIKNVDLTRGIWIEGRAYDKDTGEPIQQGRVDYFAFRNNPYRKTVKGFNGAFLATRYRLNPDGTYRIPGLPGRGLVAILAEGVDTIYQRGRGAEKIHGRQDGIDGFDTYPFFASAFNFHVMSEVNPTEEAKTIKLDFLFESGRSLHVQVVDQSGKPINGGYYAGMMKAFNNWRIFKGSLLEIKGYQPENPRLVQVFLEERKLVGYLLIKGNSPTNLKITLEPWAEITGRFVDASGVPQARAQIGNVFQSRLDNPEIVSLPPNLKKQTGNMMGFDTDENGRFTITGLVPGKEHRISASETRKNGSGYYLGDFAIDPPLKPGEVRDLGDIQLKPKGAE